MTKCLHLHLFVLRNRHRHITYTLLKTCLVDIHHYLLMRQTFFLKKLLDIIMQDYNFFFPFLPFKFAFSLTQDEISA